MNLLNKLLEELTHLLIHIKVVERAQLSQIIITTLERWTYYKKKKWGGGCENGINK